VLLGVLVLVVVGCGDKSGPERNEQSAVRDEQPGGKDKQSDDEKLVKRVREAVDEKKPLETVEEFVNVKATIHTSRTRDRLILQRVASSRDPEEAGPIPLLRQAKAVVYWVRPLEAENPKIIGIVWDKKGQMELFYGIILPR